MLESFDDYRMGHLVRTAEIWKRLQELGANAETPLDFDFSFEADSKDSVARLEEALSDYTLNVETSGLLRKSYTITRQSGPITWSEEVLLKWVDYLVQIGEETGCTFSGCGASAPS